MNLHLKTILTLLAVITIFGLISAGALLAPQITTGIVMVITVGGCATVIYQTIYDHYKRNQKRNQK